MKKEYTRSDRGSKHHHAKIDEDDVRLILELYEEGKVLRERLKTLSLKGIGEKFGIAPQTVYDIVSGRSWRHV
jgi:hypothetical protein